MGWPELSKNKDIVWRKNKARNDSGTSKMTLGHKKGHWDRKKDTGT
jgi:hypothetical protein